MGGFDCFPVPSPRPSGPLAVALGLLLALLLLLPGPALAARDDNRYDGNIYALYAGNGSLVPPRNSLAEALDDHRVVLLGFYLDDSAASKAMAPTFSELQRLWGRSVELILLGSDPLQNRPEAGPRDPAHYWHGQVPQVVVLDRSGRVSFDGEGSVPLERINAALAAATGIELPASAPSRSREINEFNRELVSSPAAS